VQIFVFFVVAPFSSVPLRLRVSFFFLELTESEADSG